MPPVCRLRDAPFDTRKKTSKLAFSPWYTVEGWCRCVFPSGSGAADMLRTSKPDYVLTSKIVWVTA